MKNGTLILNEEQAAMKIERMAWQILEKNSLEKEIVIAGIAKRGFKLAEILSEKLKEISKIRIKLVEIKVDKKNPYNKEPEINCEHKELENRSVIIVDDVLNSGRTMLFATLPFMDFPVKELSIAVLLNRSYRNFPVAAKYVGQSLSTTLQENIKVQFDDHGKIRAYLM